MVKTAISQDLSWAKPARKWEAVLENLYHSNGDATTKKDSVVTPVQEKVVAKA